SVSPGGFVRSLSVGPASAGGGDRGATDVGSGALDPAVVGGVDGVGATVSGGGLPLELPDVSSAVGVNDGAIDDGEETSLPVAEVVNSGDPVSGSAPSAPCPQATNP